MIARERPVLKLEPSTGERALDLLGIAAVLASIVDLAAMWNRIPERVPSHFDFSGNVNGDAGKWSLWLLPAISAVIVVALTWLRRIPHFFNYPFAITAENAPAMYRAGRDLLTWLKTTIAVMFAALTGAIARVSLGGSTAAIVWIVPAMLVGVFGSVIWQIVRMARAR